MSQSGDWEVGAIILVIGKWVGQSGDWEVGGSIWLFGSGWVNLVIGKCLGYR